MRGQLKSYTQNKVIFSEGDVGDCAYLIEKGRVLIYVNKGDTEIALKVLGEGEVFGEMSLIDNSPRSASCRAIGDAHLIVVTKDQLIDRIQDADPVVRLLMRALLERLRSQNDSIRGKKIASKPKKAETHDKDTKEAVERIELENRIFNALNNDEFAPYYQPIYDLKTCKICGCEALLRWITPAKEVISPAIFMDVVEESALVLQAGKVAIEKCMRDLPRLRKAVGDGDFYVSVNVSGRQFADPQFVSHLEESRERLNVKPSEIKLEVTERVMTEGPVALATLQKCRELGYLLAIDDFGTGFSSLQYLASMPLTDLKIDRSFVMKVLSDEKSLSIVKSLIHMAGLLGLSLIAEGIETHEQLKLLRDLGVDSGQGYVFSKAIPCDEFVKLTSPFIPQSA